MIKAVDARSYNNEQPKIRFYDTEKRNFVKNSPETRRNALFAMVLCDSYFDIEQFELEGYANKFVNLLNKNQEKPFVGLDDIDEFVDDLEREFNLRFVDAKHSQVFEELATVVVCDQKKECAYKAEDFASLVDSVKNAEEFAM